MRKIGVFIFSIVLIFILVCIVSALESIYEYQNLGGSQQRGNWGPYWNMQTFTVGTVGPNEDFIITKVGIKVQRYGGSITGPIIISVKEVDENNHPTGKDIANGTIGQGLIPASLNWVNVSMTLQTTLHSSKQYAVGIQLPNSDGSSRIDWGYNPSGAYYGGNVESTSNNGGTWSTLVSEDFIFEIYGTDPCSDLDDDGVCDELDKCPDTPIGDNVDSNGCSISDVESRISALESWKNSLNLTPINLTMIQNHESRILSLESWQTTISPIISTIQTTIMSILTTLTGHTAQIEALEQNPGCNSCANQSENQTSDSKYDSYFRYQSFNDRKNMVCGYGKDNHLTNVTDLGVTCIISYPFVNKYNSTSRTYYQIENPKCTCR